MRVEFAINTKLKMTETSRQTKVIRTSIKSTPTKAKCPQLVASIFCCWLVFSEQTHSHLPIIAAEAESQDLNGNVPIFTQHNNVLHFSIAENQPVGTLVGKVISSDQKIPSFILAVAGKVTSDREIQDTFAYNSSTGEVFTKIPLDREKRDNYQFFGLLHDPFAEVKCSVNVLDVNDNAPMFVLENPEQTHLVIDFHEGQKGLRKMLPIAVDADTPINGIKEFRLTTTNSNGLLDKEYFGLIEHGETRTQNNSAIEDISNPSLTLTSDPNFKHSPFEDKSYALMPQSINSNSPNSLATSYFTYKNSLHMNSLQASGNIQSKWSIDLEVLKPLDRENQSTYHFILEAYDDSPTHLAKITLTVNVLDINDNDPVFNQSRYECLCREDTPKGNRLIRVQAHDADLEANGQISYSIRRHTSSSQTFPTINSNLSDINEVSTANRYTTQAPNANSKQRQAQANTPLNNVKQISQRNQPVTNEVYENHPTTSNSDQLNSAIKTQRIPSHGVSTQDQMFEIDPVKGDIYLVHQLDFETDQMHELIIEAKDHGKIPRSSQTVVKVIVIDVNDDPPPTVSRLLDDRKTQIQPPSSEASKSEYSVNRLPGDFSDFSQNYLQNFYIISWFAHMNSSLLFVFVLIILFAIAFPVCLVKIKSRQPESDYNDTDGLNPNSGPTKLSPNHSTSNEHSNGTSDGHQRYHDHQRRTNGLFGGPNGTGSSFGSPNGKYRYHYVDSSNLYHNPYSQQQIRHSTSHLQQTSESPTGHQMANGSSAGVEMGFCGPDGRAGVPRPVSRAPIGITQDRASDGENATGTYDLQEPAVLVGSHENSFPHDFWLGKTARPPQYSPWLNETTRPIACTPSQRRAPAAGGTMSLHNHGLSGSAPSQLVHAQDWYGSYNWDYLCSWEPEYNNLMQLMEADASNCRLVCQE